MDPERGGLASRAPSIGSRSQSASNLAIERRAPVRQQQETFNSAAFWLLGLLNNSAYVIMIAGANKISSGAVGLTYLCAILPSLLVKATGPYWFHHLSYSVRSWSIATLMAVSYTTVALSGSLAPQLLGVALSSLQGGLGEATCLAMASFYDSRRVITFWSSGTGFAGVFGYSWVGLFTTFAGLSFRVTLLVANISSAAWLAVYHLVLQPPERRGTAQQLSPKRRAEPPTPQAAATLAPDVPRDLLPEEQAYPLLDGSGPGSSDGARQPSDAKAPRTKQMSLRERWQRTIVLWPYIVPLALVYFAEYSMQAGTWTAIGFPVEDPERREAFYSASNWTYQLGVFLSRSSGLAFQADMTTLWAMPTAQVGLLVFFTLDAWLHFWYSYSILILCFATGLLGGAVYVNAFTLISRDVEPEFREFSLAAASLGDSLGIAFADVCGILIQGCLFKLNELPGASFSC